MAVSGSRVSKGVQPVRARQDHVVELDILRAAAISLILLCHLPEYVVGIPGLPSLWIVRPHAGLLGLGLFTFVAGYATDLRNRNNYRDGWALWFIRKRLSRLFPLYLPALLGFIALFGVLRLQHDIATQTTLPSILTHVLAAQGLAAPRLTPIFTLWYIGTIVLYYFTYIAVHRFGVTIRRFLITASLVFLAMIATKYFLKCIDVRFFWYFASFIGGILANRMGLFSARRRIFNFACFAGALLVFAGATFLTHFTHAIVFIEQDRMTWSLRDLIRNATLAQVYLASGILIAAAIAQSIRRLGIDSLLLICSFLSTVSCAIYLVHRLVLAPLTFLAGDVLKLGAISHDVLLLCVGFPLVLLASYCLQRLESWFLAGRIGTNAVPADG